MEALQMLKFALKGSSLDFTAGTGRDAELEALAMSANESGRLPDDMTSYISHLLHDPELEEDTDDEGDEEGDDLGAERDL
jgi:hypothetical protein